MSEEIKYVRSCSECAATVETEEPFKDVLCPDCEQDALEDWIEKKEQIAFIIFDHDYVHDDYRPLEEDCHEIAEKILNYLENKENE